MEKQLCEIRLHFKVPKEKAKHLFKAVNQLKKAGISFDTGGYADNKYIHYDWEFDWSLRGDCEVIFKKMK